MKRKMSKKWTLSWIALTFTILSFAQQSSFYSGVRFPLLKKDSWLDVRVRKSGPYVGVQRGKYWVGEAGVEMQFKKLKLIKPVTHGIHTGFNYNLIQNVLGYDLGYWVKPGRFNLTYGGNVVLRTNFSETRVGIAPVVGFKLAQFHLQTGFHLLTPSNTFKETNTFFVALRFVIINKRDWDVDRDKKQKSGDQKRWFERK